MSGDIWQNKRLIPFFMACLIANVGHSADEAAVSVPWRPTSQNAIDGALTKIVKVFGAGGAGLEAYQSGVLISSEGHVLTAWSYVLDTNPVFVILDDGRRFNGELVGLDPQLEVAVLKIPAGDLPFFSLSDTPTPKSGQSVFAYSNLYGVASYREKVSVQKGVISGIAPLSAKRGSFETAYQGDVLLVDAITNNPGAAGGALTDRQGKLIGLLGKEMKSVGDGTFLNYAIPTSALTTSVEEILAGKWKLGKKRTERRRPQDAHRLDRWGVALIPNVLSKTPPYVEYVDGDSPASKAGLRPDDLILLVNGRLVSAIDSLAEELTWIDALDPVELTVQRGQDLVVVVIEIPGA